MKLLGWMHQKFQQKPETLKELTIGTCCTCLSAKPSLNDQDYPTKPSFGSTYYSGSLKQLEREYEKSFSDIGANRVEENYEEQTSLVVSESFHGFLSIGTFGSEPIINEPETPTFATPLETVTEKKIEVTENDLKLISYELEKFLEAEGKEEGRNESPGRNSHVSSITLDAKQIEGDDDEDYRKLAVCPLQGYLFGSSIELPETKIELKKEKASLAELFQRTKIADESPKDEEMQKKRTPKSSMRLIKKMLKKLTVSSKSGSHSAGDDIVVSATKNKLQKVLQIFHKKIHPESSVAAREFDKSPRNKNENILRNHGCGNMHPDEDYIRHPRGSSNNLNLPQYRVNGSITSKNKEHWIKTDADYLVLEL